MCNMIVYIHTFKVKKIIPGKNKEEMERAIKIAVFPRQLGKYVSVSVSV